MPKYFTSFKVNTSKWPLDPKVALKAAEANFAGMADMEKKASSKKVDHSVQETVL